MGEINKTDKSFKILINKRFTADADSLSGRPFFTEVGADTLNIHSREVWTHPVPTNPQEALDNGIAKYYDKFVLTSDNSLTSNNPTQQAWFVQSGSGFIPDGDTFDSSLGQTDFISDKYGLDYEIELFDNNDTLISKVSPINWIFDYKVGVLHVANPGAAAGLGIQKPYKVSVYQYIGNILSSSINSDGLIEAVGFPFSGSALITGSLIISGAGNITASGGISASSITANSFTIDNFIVNDISASNITASGHISASSLSVDGNVHIGGDLDIEGSVDFDAFTFVEDNVTILTGSNSFGATASLNQHTFTGSIIISSSQDKVFDVISGSTSVFSIDVHGNLIGSDIFSSSAQIAQDISGSWQGYITGSGIISSSGQIGSLILTGSGIVSSSGQIGSLILTGSGIVSSSGQIGSLILTGSGIVSNSLQFTNTDDVTFRNITASSYTLHHTYFENGDIPVITEGTNPFGIVIGSKDHELLITSSNLIIDSGNDIRLDANSITLSPTTTITASGDISASGTIVASNLSGTNTGDQDLSNLAIIGDSIEFGNITASGDISASGLLFAGINQAPAHTAPIVAVVYDSGSGQFYYTGSYNEGAGGTGTGFPFSGSALITGSLIISGAGHISASGNITASNLEIKNSIILDDFSDAKIAFRDVTGAIGNNTFKFNEWSAYATGGIKIINKAPDGGIILDNHVTTSNNISSSANISADTLFVQNNAIISGNLDLEGSFNFDTFTFTEDNTISITGSNSFGSTASLNQHTFTGSVVISSSQNTVLNIISGSTSVFSVDLEGGIGGTMVSAISGSWQGYISGSGIISGSDQITTNLSGSGVISSSTGLFLASDLTASLDADVGGVSNGDEFGPEHTIEFLLRQILVQYLSPSLSDFEITDLASRLEVGDTDTVNGGTFKVTNDSEGAPFSSYDLILSNNQPNNSLTGETISLDESNDGTISFDNKTIKLNTVGTVTFTLKGTDTTGVTAQSSNSDSRTDFRLPIFFGGSPETGEGLNDNVLGLILADISGSLPAGTSKIVNINGQSCIDASNALHLPTIKLTVPDSVADENNFTYIVYPSDYGDLTQILKNDVQDEFGTFGQAPLGEANHTRFGVTTTYKVYRSAGQNAYGTSDKLTIND